MSLTLSECENVMVIINKYLHYIHHVDIYNSKSSRVENWIVRFDTYGKNYIRIDNIENPPKLNVYYRKEKSFSDNICIQNLQISDYWDTSEIFNCDKYNTELENLKNKDRYFLILDEIVGIIERIKISEFEFWDMQFLFSIKDICILLNIHDILEFENFKEKLISHKFIKHPLYQKNEALIFYWREVKDIIQMYIDTSDSNSDITYFGLYCYDTISRGLKFTEEKWRSDIQKAQHTRGYCG
jgi:hypothetical protein